MEKIKTLTRPALLILITFLLYSINVFAEKEPYLVKKFDASGVSFLDVNTSGGSIKAVGSKGENQIVVEMYVNSWKSSWSKEKVESELEDYEITIEKRGDKVVAYAKRNSSFNWTNNISISFTIYTPSSISSSLKTSGGSISVSGLTGEQDMHTSGGSIDLDDLNGEIDASTSGGSIDIKNINGKMKGSTSGGSIRAENLKGDFNLHTSGGGIHLDNINGSIYGETSGGGIHANIVNVTGDITLKTSGGSIHATLPDNLGIDVDFKGNSVNTHLKNFSGTSDDDRIVGSINGGGNKVTLATSGGSVNVDYQ